MKISKASSCIVDPDEGVDVDPTEVNKRGSKEFPFKSIAFAVDLGGKNTTKFIMLKEGKLTVSDGL